MVFGVHVNTHDHFKDSKQCKGKMWRTAAQLKGLWSKYLKQANVVVNAAFNHGTGNKSHLQSIECLHLKPSLVMVIRHSIFYYYFYYFFIYKYFDSCLSGSFNLTYHYTCHKISHNQCLGFWCFTFRITWGCVSFYCF